MQLRKMSLDLVIIFYSAIMQPYMMLNLFNIFYCAICIKRFRERHLVEESPVETKTLLSRESWKAKLLCRAIFTVVGEWTTSQKVLYTMHCTVI